MCRISWEMGAYLVEYFMLASTPVRQCMVFGQAIHALLQAQVP